jgi:hypothetical protein
MVVNVRSRVDRSGNAGRCRGGGVMKKGGTIGADLGVQLDASSTYILLVFGSASWRSQSGAMRDCP